MGPTLNAYQRLLRSNRAALTLTLTLTTGGCGPQFVGPDDGDTPGAAAPGVGGQGAGGQGAGGQGTGGQGTGQGTGGQGETDALRTYAIALTPSNRHAALQQGLRAEVTVGGGPHHSVMLDTGSTSLVIPKSALGPGSVPIAPREPFTVHYASTGLKLQGYRALAVVRIGEAKTSKMKVNVVEQASCSDEHPECQAPRDLTKVGVMGIGYGPGNRSMNPLLNVTDVAKGTMRPGYSLSVNPSAKLVIGIPKTAPGFEMMDLKRQGDDGWSLSSLKGCVRIPRWSSDEDACGALLVDSGTSAMIIARPKGAIADSSFVSADSPFKEGAPLPDGVEVSVATPNFERPTLKLGFTTGEDTPATPSGVWHRTSEGGGWGFILGRHMLAHADYIFDDENGRAGFKPVAR